MQRENGASAGLNDETSRCRILAVAGLVTGQREGSARGRHEDVIHDMQVMASCTQVSNTAGGLISFRISEKHDPARSKGPLPFAYPFIHAAPRLLCHL